MNGAKPVAATNIVALVVMLAIGFGSGLLVATAFRDRSLQKEIDDAVAAERKECDARIELARLAPVAPASSAAPPAAAASAAAPATASSADEGARAASGKDMINRLLQRKGTVSGGGAQEQPSAPPVTSQAPPPEETKSEEKPYAKVMQTSSRSAWDGIHVSGSIKNLGVGMCKAAEVEVTARDSRGVVSLVRSVAAAPEDIEGFATSNFEVIFPPGTDAASFTALVKCR